MKRGYEQESLYTITQHAEEFKNKVNVSIDTEEEKSGFYQALKTYHESGSITQFINDIKSVINTPKRYPLYKDIRYLINPEHVEAYLKMIPNSPSDGIHMVRIQRTGREPMGFTIRGGKEHCVGIFVSLVTRGSPADIVGLKEGDEILTVNNMILSEATHDEVVDLLRSRRVLLLKVKSIGKVPCKINDAVTWEAVEDKDEVYYHPDLLDHLVQQGTLSTEQPFKVSPGDKRAFMHVGHKGIGCSIRNGIPGKDGLFVVSVNPGSLSDRTGLRVGDEIIAINDQHTVNFSYSEAVYLLKTLKQLNLVLRHSKEVEDFICEEEASNDQERVPEFALKTQLLMKKAEEKEKQRREKAKEEMHFETLAKVKSQESLDKEEISTRSAKSSTSGSISSSSSRTSPTNPTATDAFQTPITKTGVSLSEMTPNSRKKALFTERIQMIEPLSVSNTNTPSELPLPIFNPSNCDYGEDVLRGRESSLITIDKVSDLGIAIEERNGGIYVNHVNTEGSAAQSGALYPGDQLLNVEGTSLIGISLAQAHKELKEAMERRSESLDLVVALAPSKQGDQPRRRGVIKIKTDKSGHEIYDTWL
ncbi:harmonin-like isoform X2 [Nematostella vectensis]|uniref:harmonin-like isoform X2 n=1 Tax=Nematostella vectensis TaxID=45351 RepID=UPI0020776E76|nr:harmonin-like isoform X2 [Nematostella vectensis]